jgi:hypothetical protein
MKGIVAPLVGAPVDAGPRSLANRPAHRALRRQENPIMPRKIFHCCVCSQPEDRCHCVKYCALCHSDYDIRLTEDGQYYCLDCREACDYKTQDNV